MHSPPQAGRRLGRWRAALATRRAAGVSPTLRRSRAHGDVAVARDQALAVFEPAQFLHRRHRDVRIRADAPGAAGIEVGAQREQAVAEVGFGGRADRDGRAAARDALHFRIGQVGRVHQRPARVDRARWRAAIRPGARRAAARQSWTSPTCSAMWMCTRHRRRQCGQHLRASLAAAPRAGCAARSRCAARRPRVRAQRVEQAQVSLDVVAEAALPFAPAARPSKPPVMYSTGSRVRRMPVSRAAAISARDIAAGSAYGRPSGAWCR